MFCVLRQVTLFEELVLLKEYEKSEDVLAEKVSSKQQEKLDMHSKVKIRPKIKKCIFLVTWPIFFLG